MHSIASDSGQECGPGALKENSSPLGRTVRVLAEKMSLGVSLECSQSLPVPLHTGPTPSAERLRQLFTVLLTIRFALLWHKGFSCTVHPHKPQCISLDRAEDLAVSMHPCLVGDKLSDCC